VLAGIDEDRIHLMTQVMKTWIVADPEAVAAYYNKTKHVPDLLAPIDESKVRLRCKCCDTLFHFLQTRIKNL